MEQWLDAFQTALNLRDASMNSPLKGLPKAKANRKETPPTQAIIEPLPSNPEPTKWAHIEDIPDIPDVDDDNSSKVKVVSYRALTEDEVKVSTLPPTTHLTQSTQTKPRPHSVLELDSDKSGPIQFLGYKTLTH